MIGTAGSVVSGGCLLLGALTAAAAIAATCLVVGRIAMLPRALIVTAAIASSAGSVHQVRLTVEVSPPVAAARCSGLLLLSHAAAAAVVVKGGLLLGVLPAAAAIAAIGTAAAGSVH